MIGVLLGELRTDLIEELRRTIRFGEKGHSAIVDKFGRVIAHPNPKWMEEMHDLSAQDLVQKMMRGESGVTEFYSPFLKEQMVAGYAAVPEIGWGVMVPQPKSEIERQVRALLYAQFGWAFSVWCWRWGWRYGSRAGSRDRSTGWRNRRTSWPTTIFGAICPSLPRIRPRRSGN